MKQGKYAAPVRRRRRRNTLKPMLIAMAVVLLLGCVTGGTLAWLTSTTNPVTNTFTVGDINIDLAETTSDYKMIPGYTIAKDPKVTVKANSEKCYLFVKVTENIGITEYDFDDYISYTIDSSWTEVDSTRYPGVYYQIVDSATGDQEFTVLAGDKVTVNDTVTKDMMNKLGTDTTKYPTLTFQAAAVQYNKNNTTKFEVTDALDEITWG